jgi:hypothetical protein
VENITRVSNRIPDLPVTNTATRNTEKLVKWGHSHESFFSYLFYAEQNRPSRIIRNVPLHIFNSFRIANIWFQFPISALQIRCLRKDSALTIFKEKNPFRKSNNQFPIPEITHLLCNQKVYYNHLNSPPVDFNLNHTSAFNMLSPVLKSLF